MKDLLTRQLPAPMASDPNLVRFLGIFEEIAGPLYRRAGEHHLLVSPATAPPRLLEWMTSIMDVEIDGLDEAQRRRLAQTVIETRLVRGSTYAIQRLLEVYTGGPVTVIEGGGVGYDADGQDRERPDRPPVRRPPPPDGVETAMTDRDPAIVEIDVATLGVLTPQRFVRLVRKMVPAHLLVVIKVEGQELDAGQGFDEDPELREAS